MTDYCWYLLLIYLSTFLSRYEEVEAKKRNLEAQRVELENRLSELKAIMSTTIVHKQQLSDTVEKASSTLGQKEQFYKNLGQKLSKLFYKHNN